MRSVLYVWKSNNSPSIFTKFKTENKKYRGFVHLVFDFANYGFLYYHYSLKNGVTRIIRSIWQPQIYHSQQPDLLSNTLPTENNSELIQGPDLASE